MAERGRGPLLTRAADVAGALVTAVLAFTVVPAVLLFVVGNPLRAGAGHSWSLLSCDALCVLTVAAWVAWAACCAQILRSVMARVRRGEGRDATGIAGGLARPAHRHGRARRDLRGCAGRSVVGFWSGPTTSTRSR